MKYADHPFWRDREIPIWHTLMEKYIDVDFELRQSDIDAGVQGSSLLCPLNFALERFLGKDFKEIEVYPNCARIGITVHANDYAMRHFSPEVTQWIVDFDLGKDVNPMTLNFTREKSGQTNPVLTISEKEKT